MPRRDDLKRILILGSGPIRIGQAAEFDFSGSQACRALRADGYEVILINSNPATIFSRNSKRPNFKNSIFKIDFKPCNSATSIFRHGSNFSRKIDFHATNFLKIQNDTP